MAINRNSFHIVSLGCAKNLVDSNAMAQLMQSNGMDNLEKARKARYIIVNTCGFIQSARDESINVLSELASQKKKGQVLIAAGCMSQRYQKEMLKMVTGIDGMIGTRRWMDILEVIDQLENQENQLPYLHFPLVETIGRDEKNAHAVAIQGSSSYLKIADGCRRQCAFCAIPMIKGTLVSRPLGAIIKDALYLQSQGVREINLIAQDVTDYGQDLGLKDGLVTLLSELLPKLPDIPWLRLLYTFPGYISRSLINLMANETQIVPYLDMPLQHADPKILKAMHRPSDLKWVRDTLSEFKERIPSIALRSTFIVGYPGETDRSFQKLLDFIEEIRFDHVGAFTYSFEYSTLAEHLGDPIPEDVKKERLEALMTMQAKISLQKNQDFIGKNLDVLIEGSDPDKQILIGRSYRDAPEVDGLVIIEGQAQIGEIIKTKITGAMQHDLIGQKLKTN